MDIPHADRGKYFTFNQIMFPPVAHHELNQIIEQSSRRLVLIVDPHIKVTDEKVTAIESSPSRTTQHERGGHPACVTMWTVGATVGLVKREQYVPSFAMLKSGK